MLANLNLRETVEALMSQHNEDAIAARGDLVKRSHLHAELLKLGADQAIRNYFQAGRRQTEEEREEKSARRKKSTTKAKRKARAIVKLFWDRYSLFGHMLLGDATAKDLRASASKRIAQAAGNQRAAEFELSLMNRMAKKPGAKVRDFLSIRAVMEDARAHNVTKK